MSGHSKWNNIKRRKEKTDTQKAKVFTKIGREIAVIVKSGGPDPDVNAKLKDAIAKARSNNMPNENIQRCIKKAAGEGSGDTYEDIIYEGYGPSGVAVVVETLTDNRNRTAGDMRHYFDKYGGNLGQTGCVTFMFVKKGVIIILKDNVDEDKLMNDALEAEAEDFNVLDDCFEILTSYDNLGKVRDALEQKGYSYESAEVDRIPQTTVDLISEIDIKNMTRLIDILEDNDDVQNVFHNWNAPEDEVEE